MCGKSRETSNELDKNGNLETLYILKVRREVRFLEKSDNT